MIQKANGGVGLACAGGVVEGAFYEIGVLCALEEAVGGLDLNRLGAYVGVSAGAIMAACLANGIPAHEMARAVVARADPLLNLRPGVLFTPATREYVGRLGRVPGKLVDALRHWLREPADIGILGALLEVGTALPIGLFDNAPLERYMARAFAVPGRTNDFRDLASALRVVAVNLDTSELVAFGEPGTEHVPIARAVRASSALPVLYCPVEIDGEYYIDGVARRTLNASQALSEGMGLVFCINPIVPVNMKVPDEQGRRSLVDYGLPAVLSQTFRTVIHSRMGTGFRSYEHLFPEADLVLIEPSMDDHRMFFTNIFSFSNRYQVCEHAYASTRAWMRTEAPRLRTILARHGLELRDEVLAERRVLFGGHPHPHDPAAHDDPGEDAHAVLDRLEVAVDRLLADAG